MPNIWTASARPRAYHRDEFLASERRLVDRLLQFVAVKVLASRLLFLVTLTIPLISLLPELSWMQKLVIILSSNWLQAWALPALQFSANDAAAKADAKADVDHHSQDLILHYTQELWEKLV